VRLCQAAGYQNLATVEFLLEGGGRHASLMEVNPRLQVEHAVTELTTGTDLVQMQIHLARGGRLEGTVPQACGHAIEVRLNAEDATSGFAPSPGRLVAFRAPTRAGLRVDGGAAEGDEIRPEYDSMFAKMIAYGPTRDEALNVLARGLDDSTAIIEGGVTNRAFLRHLLDLDEVQKGRVSIDWLDGLVERGQHVSYEHADVALLVAAVEVYDADFAAERDEFFASAQRLRPITSREIGRGVEFRYRGRRYPMRVYRIGAEHYRVDVGGGRVDLGLDPVGPHQRIVTYDGSRHRVVVTSHGLTHIVEVEGAVHWISRDEAGLVRAFAPAVVVEMSVHPGDHVSAGDRIALLEAMKMETPVTAPCTGVVRDVLVLQNAQVGPGTALVHIDPDVTDEAEPGEAVRFRGAVTPATRGGAVPSRTRAALAGLKAFKEALSVPDAPFAERVLTDLRDLVLGSDIDAAEARRLLDDYRHICERMPADHELLLAGEEKVLRVFTDVSALFRSQPGGEEANDASALSAGQYFLTYLRTLESRGAGLPPAFVAELERALAHYGSDSLDVTHELRSRLLWMWKAHQRADQQVGIVVAILERRLRHAAELGARAGQSFLTLLDRLIASSEGRHPALNDLARDVRYRYFEQPTFDRDRRMIYAEMEGHLAYLMRAPDAADREDRIRALVDCPLPLSDLLSGRLEGAAPVLRQLVLEVLSRRYYRIRAVERVTATELADHSLVAAEYDFEGRRVHLFATHAAWEGLPVALQGLGPTIDAVAAGDDVVLDLYVLRATGAEGPAETSAALAGVLNNVGIVRPIRRIVVAVAGPRGEWATSSTGYFTFRGSETGYVEDRLYRGLHPMIGKRLETWRFRHFDIDRLPSAEDVYLFHGVARDNPKDERLFALGEVRDATPVRDADGTLLQVPHLERTMLECLSAIREVQFRKSPDERLQWNRVVLDVWPALTLTREELLALMRRLGHETEGLGIEKVVVRAQMPDDRGTVGETRLSLSNPGGHGLVLRFEEPHDRALQPLDEYTQKIVRMRQRGLAYPYEVVRLLTPGRDRTESDMPPGEFVEYDLAGEHLVPVERPWGRNTANVVVGLMRNFTPKYPEGLARVALFGDPGREMGSLAEPECRRILAALDLAEKMRLPLEWFALSAGAKISMESGTENMDWIGRVLRKIIEFTQAGHEINIIVTGINVGAQPYWNAEATMLMHTRGILVMMPESAMVLTGKTALDYSGSVSAEDNLGIGGYERIMGPNGQAQYWARDINEACHILLRHYDHTYVAPGESFPRRAQTSDPFTRDVCRSPHGRIDGIEFRLVGDVFSDTTNPGRKKPFDIRRIMQAVSDQDHVPLERWPGMRDGEIGVIWDAHVGGYPVCMLGFESRSLPRLGFVPTDGPDHWTSGTLFPMSSKKIARAINAASGNRPLVVLANLSGFDGSPESMRRRQLEFGAEIGRAVTNFQGPIVFVVISRYHGGAFVVFSRTLNDNMQVAALEGTYASVIGGAPAAAVVFAREVDGRTRKDPRVKALEQELTAADEEGRRRLRPRLAALVKSVRSEKLGEVADEFDRIHSVHRALEVGSLDTILPPSELRPYVIQAVEAGLAREVQRRGKSS
jgi:acetyl-CoA carboxylase carboxyltransferase component/biotin carboxyl carrier protein